jgi:hypothetical protein
LKTREAEEAVAGRIRIIKHAASGSYEVRFSDGRPSKYFYWEDIPGRRLRSEQADGKQALEEANSFRAGCKRSRLDGRQVANATKRVDRSAPIPIPDTAR